METFDEKFQKALRILMEKFWVLRQKEPELYQYVREREKVIKRYVEDKLGFDLIVHQHFIKLEKLPVETRSWMGIRAFQEPRDYAMFCCALAFTENRTVDEQFLLSDICEDLHDLYPGEIGLDWTNYNHRRSLVRVIKQLEKLAILHVVEGEIDQFALDEEKEVLYEVTVYARYFMRSYPKDLYEYDTAAAILAGEWERHGQDVRRKRVYRKLMITPVLYRESEDDPDFAYVRNFRNMLREDLEKHTGLRLEVFKNAALLVAEERKQELKLFPDQKAIMDVALHFATYIREQEDVFLPDAFGNIRMSRVQLEQTVKALHEQYSKGWSKQYREGTITATTGELKDVLLQWEMMSYEVDTDLYLLRPLLGRVAGAFPTRFTNKGEDTNGSTR